MGSTPTKRIDQNFFKTWSPEMSYVLGYIVADGCITIDKARSRSPFSLNITSKDRSHLFKIRKKLDSEHKIGRKSNGVGGTGFQFQIRNKEITEDLMKLGVYPRKTQNLDPIDVPQKYFSHFVRGFFDGDGSVYIYNVNGTPQIKTQFVCTSALFYRTSTNVCAKA